MFLNLGPGPHPLATVQADLLFHFISLLRLPEAGVLLCDQVVHLQYNIIRLSPSVIAVTRVVLTLFVLPYYL